MNLVVVNGDEDGAVLSEEFLEQLEAGPHHAEPLVVALEVFAINGVGGFLEPLSHERGVDGVVVAPALRAGVVGRVDIDAVHVAGVARQQGLESFEIVAVDYEVVVEVGLTCLASSARRGHALLWYYQQLAIRHTQMVRVDEALSFEIK